MAPSEPPPLLSRRLLALILALAALVYPTSPARKIPASVTPISRDLYRPQVRCGKVRRKRMRSSENAVSTRVAAIIASKSCHKTGKRRGCEGASSLPLLVTGRPPSQVPVLTALPPFAVGDYFSHPYAAASLARPRAVIDGPICSVS